MRHHATERFRACLRELPEGVQRSARAAFERLKRDPHHPGLHFKKIGRFHSARIGAHYRALAVAAGDEIVWFWIGTHAGYDELIG